MICLLIGAVPLELTEPKFTLSWEHSVEHVVWQEDWEIVADGLKLVEARIKGSGAGMEAGEGAVLKDGYWMWKPELEVQNSLSLAASGATGDGWNFCSSKICQVIGRSEGEPIHIRLCD